MYYNYIMGAQVSYRRAGKVSQALGDAIAHDDDAQVRQRILIEELPDEALQHAGHDRQPVGPHVPNRGSSGQIHQYLHEKAIT